MKFKLEIFLMITFTTVLFSGLSKEKYHEVRPIADFEETQAILLSSLTFDDSSDIRPVVKAIIEAGAYVIVLFDEIMSKSELDIWKKERKIDSDVGKKIFAININHDNRWIKDFSPIYVESRNYKGKLEVKFLDYVYRNSSYLSDVLPYQLGITFEKSVEHVPLSHDIGNFLTNGKDCFVAFTEVNVEYYNQTYQEDLTKSLKIKGGCENVTVFNNAVHEHIDMWAQVLGEKTAIVSEVTPETIEFASKNKYKKMSDLLKIQSQLNTAADMMGQTMDVYRIPHPVRDLNIFRTFTNGIIVNKTILVPRYLKHSVSDIPYFDEALTESYEKQVQEVYESLGFAVKFFEVDSWIAEGGGLHCISSNIPKRLNIIAERVRGTTEN